MVSVSHRNSANLAKFIESNSINFGRDIFCVAQKFHL